MLLYFAADRSYFLFASPKKNKDIKAELEQLVKQQSESISLSPPMASAQGFTIVLTQRPDCLPKTSNQEIEGHLNPVVPN